MFGDITLKLKKVEERLHELDLLAEVKTLEKAEMSQKKDTINEVG